MTCSIPTITCDMVDLNTSSTYIVKLEPESWILSEKLYFSATYFLSEM